MIKFLQIILLFEQTSVSSNKNVFFSTELGVRDQCIMEKKMLNNSVHKKYFDIELDHAMVSCIWLVWV